MLPNRHIGSQRINVKLGILKLLGLSFKFFLQNNESFNNNFGERIPGRLSTLFNCFSQLYKIRTNAANVNKTFDLVNSSLYFWHHFFNQFQLHVLQNLFDLRRSLTIQLTQRRIYQANPLVYNFFIQLSNILSIIDIIDQRIQSHSELVQFLTCKTRNEKFCHFGVPQEQS